MLWKPQYMYIGEVYMLSTSWNIIHMQLWTLSVSPDIPTLPPLLLLPRFPAEERLLELVPQWKVASWNFITSYGNSFRRCLQRHTHVGDFQVYTCIYILFVQCAKLPWQPGSWRRSLWRSQVSGWYDTTYHMAVVSRIQGERYIYLLPPHTHMATPHSCGQENSWNLKIPDLSSIVSSSDVTKEANNNLFWLNHKKILRVSFFCLHAQEDSLTV